MVDNPCDRSEWQHYGGLLVRLCSVSDQVGKRGAVEVYTLTRYNLGLTTKWKVIGIFGNENMCDCYFCR